MDSLQLERKIGQLLIIGFQGSSLKDSGVQKVLEQIKACKIGGVIIFRYNIESPEALNNMLKEFKAAAGDRQFFIMLDQEGGKVQRLNSANGFKDFLSAKQVANTLNLEQAFQHYLEMGQLIATTGFNFNAAPCVDLDCDPPCVAIGKFERSYANDSKTVSDYAEQALLAFKQSGVMGCIKHFPGHGRANDDSHEHLVDITNTWSEEELQPYAELINKGLVKAVMTAHLINRSIDASHCATLSKIWLTKLRTDLGFEGAIVSDDLHMGAILKKYSLSEIVTLGLNAGLNLLVFSNNPLAVQSQGIRNDNNTVVTSHSGYAMAVPNPDLPDLIISEVLSAIELGTLSIDTIEKALQHTLVLDS